MRSINFILMFVALVGLPAAASAAERMNASTVAKQVAGRIADGKWGEFTCGVASVFVSKDEDGTLSVDVTAPVKDAWNADVKFDVLEAVSIWEMLCPALYPGSKSPGLVFTYSTDGFVDKYGNPQTAMIWGSYILRGEAEKAGWKKLQEMRERFGAYEALCEWVQPRPYATDAWAELLEKGFAPMNE